MEWLSPLSHKIPAALHWRQVFVWLSTVDHYRISILRGFAAS
jgi:hypothetical protein